MSAALTMRENTTADMTAVHMGIMHAGMAAAAAPMITGIR